MYLMIAAEVQYISIKNKQKIPLWKVFSLEMLPPAKIYIKNTMIPHNFGDFILSRSGTRSMKTVKCISTNSESIMPLSEVISLFI